jgi:hypothetical protein
VVGVPANHQINWVVLNYYRATQTDRKFHFWERRPRTIQVVSYAIAMQKLEYIDRNPCYEKWSLSAETISDKYSSAAFYEVVGGDANQGQKIYHHIISHTASVVAICNEISLYQISNSIFPLVLRII